MGAAVVLLYHRVYDTDFDPLLLSVSPDNFDAQMTYLRRRYALLSLEELRGALGKGSLPRGAVAITFDDGYGDNLRNARPILDRHRIPATVFVTTGYTGSGREFWWDELGRTLFFAPRLPERLSLSVAGTAREWAMGSASRMTMKERLADRSWTILREDNPTELHRAYREIQPILSRAPSDQRDRMLMDLREQTGSGGSQGSQEAVPAAPISETLAMTRDELRALAEGGLITIGAHTVTHPVLSTLTPRGSGVRDPPEQTGSPAGPRQRRRELCLSVWLLGCVHCRRTLPTCAPRGLPTPIRTSAASCARAPIRTS